MFMNSSNSVCSGELLHYKGKCWGSIMSSPLLTLNSDLSINATHVLYNTFYIWDLPLCVVTSVFCEYLPASAYICTYTYTYTLRW